LSTFPNTTMTRPPAPGPGHVAPAAIRRAMAHLEAHAHLPVDLREVAAAAGTSARALQYGFRRHLDTTPTRYLRRVRLERAHRDLQAGDPTRGNTVAAIAARWGYAHPGRFSVDYRHAYGCSPNETLRR
jgi:AraC-like DNA-binding protein